MECLRATDEMRLNEIREPEMKEDGNIVQYITQFENGHYIGIAQKVEVGKKGN